MRSEEQRELLARLTTNTDLQPKDCQPLRLSENTIPKPLPPAQRTVFPIDTDWTSPSVQTVLDAFKESYKAQVEERGLDKTLLPLLRASGAVEVHSSMADLFDAGLLGSTNVVTGAGERLVQCNNCHRPVLITRILGHVQRCSGMKDDAGEDTDTEMQLIIPPYGHENPSTPPKTPPPEANTPKSNSPGKGKNSDCVKGFVKDEDDWRTRITPVIPRYVPRGASSKKRRYALPPPGESPAQRKKNINVERKALAAAATAGLTSSHPQSAAHASGSSDALRKLAQKWGPSAPWSKLMQVALPLMVPRNPRKRTPTAKELEAVKNGRLVLLDPPRAAGAGSAKAGGKNVETSEKQNALAQQGPTVLGSLLWLRGQGMKELSKTPLHSMDVPQMPISRSGPVFHGQTYVAALGSFETDPRHHNTIKMPTASVGPASAANAAQARASAGRTGSTDSRAKQTGSQPTVSATNSGSSQAPPAKKQRTTKQQRSQAAAAAAAAAAANGQHFAPGVQVRTGKVPSRKMTNVRMPGGVSAGRMTVGAQEALQRMQQRNVSQPPKSVHAMNQAAAANAAAAKYAASQALQHKQVFRPGVVGNVPVSRLPPGTIPASAPNAVAPTLPTASKASAGRVVKGRTHTGVGSASPSMRSTGSVHVKSQSPGQRSTRSTDRTPMRTPAGVNQYDPALLATAAAAQVAAKGNRAAAMRPSTGNPQLDFQQVVAQMAAAQNRAGRDDAFDPTRGLVPNIAAGHQPDSASVRLRQAQAMRMSPHARLKQQAALQTAAQRNAAILKNRQAHRMRKDNREVEKTPSIGQQLQQAEALQAKSVAGKVNALSNTVPFAKAGDPTGMNAPVSHAFYSAALAGAGQATAPGAALKGQPNINPLLRMAHANQNRLMPGQADANANLLQNMHEVHQLQQNMPVVRGMRGAAQNNNVLGLLQATSLSAGFPNAGMNTGAGAGLAGNVGLPGQNPNLLTSEAILQQILAGHNPQVNPNAALHAQQMARVGLGHPQQLPRTAGIPHPVVPTASNNAALEELDRALEIDRAIGIEFDEKDLID